MEQKAGQSHPSNTTFVHDKILYVILEFFFVGSKRGQLQSCHLGFTCFSTHRWRQSLHSTHRHTILSTHRHAALEISFVPWSHRGFKNSSVGKLDSPWFWKFSMTCTRACTCSELTHSLVTSYMFIKLSSVTLLWGSIMSVMLWDIFICIKALCNRVCCKFIEASSVFTQ